MSSDNFIGVGEALIVRGKCESIKPLTAKTTLKKNSSNYFTVINYENSIIGKQVLSGLSDSLTGSILASNTSLVFRFALFEFLGLTFLITEITGDYKKCNYSSLDLQIYIPSVTSKGVDDHFKSYVKSADEFAKLLKSNASLNKMYLKLKAKSNK